MMKKIAYTSALLVLCIIIAAGCSSKASLGTAEPSPGASAGTSDTATQTVLPTSEQSGEPSYAARDAKIIKNGNTIYDAAEYEGSDTAGVGNLIVDSDALYFTEFGGTYADNEAGGDIAYSIISTDKDGKNRKVLATMKDANGYTSLVEYKDSLFYVEEGFDSVSIGDVKKDGSSDGMLDLESYAAQYDIEPYFSYANLSVDGDFLYAEIGAFLKDGTVEIHFLKIDEDLSIERIPPKEDMYTSDGSKIYRLPAGTFDKEAIYDASDYYEEDTVWVSYLESDDSALYFTEEGTPKGQVENNDFIVRTDKNGGNRQVLYTSASNEDIQLCLFKDWLFYVTQSDDYIKIRYMNKNGEGDTSLDLSDYAKQEGLDVNYQNVSLYTEGDSLYVQAKFGTQDGKSYKWLYFKIDGSLNIELVDAPE